MKVRMTHPDLDGQSIVVDEAAALIHERSGWQVDSPRGFQPPQEPGVPLPEGYVVIYNPTSNEEASVPAETVDQHRVSGWLTKPEWEANQAEQEQVTSKPKAAKAAASKED